MPTNIRASVARVMLAGPDSNPDASYNTRRQLIETIAFAAGCNTVDAALLLFWLERIVAAARLRGHKIVSLYNPELNAQYLLFARIFEANSVKPPSALVRQITQYLLNAKWGEKEIRHIRRGDQLERGQIFIYIRQLTLPPAPTPASTSSATARQTHA